MNNSRSWLLPLSLVLSCLAASPALSLVRSPTQTDEQAILRQLEPWAACITSAVNQGNDGNGEPFPVLAAAFDECADRFEDAQRQARSYGSTPNADGSTLLQEEVDQIVENVQLGLMNNAYHDILESWQQAHQKPTAAPSSLSSYLPGGGQPPAENKPPFPSAAIKDRLLSHLEPWRNWHACIENAPSRFIEPNGTTAWLKSWGSEPVIGHSPDSKVVQAMLNQCNHMLQKLRYLLNNWPVTMSVRIQEREKAYAALRKYQ